MAHYAKIDSSSEVVQVIKIDNSRITSIEGVELPWTGVVLLQDGQRDIGEDISEWVQTSYNTRGGKHYDSDGVEDDTPPIRFNYASAGYKYDRDIEGFIPPNNFTSWTLNEDTCQWESPTPYPDDDKHYMWDEEIQDWSLLEEQEIINE